MTRETALSALRSGSPHERLRAARFLTRNSKPEDLALIRMARSGEADSYVRTTLDTLISRLSDSRTTSSPEPSTEAELPGATIRKLRVQAIQEATGLLLHEVASKIGLIATAASREVPGYDTSDTKRHIENVQVICEGIEKLKGAGTTPRPGEFDLAEFISGIVAEESAGKEIEVTPLGPRPLIVNTDQRLLRFAICNGLRNAIEAVEHSRTNDPHPVVVTWGRTDVDCWITVIDRGPGFSGPVEPAFEIGKTSKLNHSGFGLAIARQAMETLDGTLTLSPDSGGGVRYELRWGH